MKEIEDHKQMLEHFPIDDLKKVADTMTDAVKKGNTIFFMGCGGSAGDAQHLAAELIGSFKIKDRKPIPAIALTTDTSILTAVGNDFGFDKIFERQVEGLVKSGDIVVGISTSGNSVAILNAIKKAKEKKAITIGFAGRTGGEMNEECHLILKMPADDGARIQEGHILSGHILCGLIESNMVLNK